jgi:hypothetical protein
MTDKNSQRRKEISLGGDFELANQMIPVGLVQLNKISQYLADLPDEAQAEFLVSPKSTATLFGGDIGKPNPVRDSERGLGTLGTRFGDGEGIDMIDESYGLHFSGQALIGKNASLFDGEREWANGVRAAWEEAKTSGHSLMTGLAIGTIELIRGHRSSSREVTVENNLYARVHDINALILRQGGEQIVTSGEGNEGAHWQLMSSDHGSAHVDIINFSNGKKDWTYTVDGPLSAGQTRYASSRAIALNVIAPTVAI